MPDFDVAIIGAGPAGSWAAYRLAKGGARVALVDGTHPREKPCGGGITTRALALIDSAVRADAIPSVPIRTATFAQGAATALVTLDDEARIVVAPRREFDGAIRDAAIAAGAHPVEAQATDIDRTSAGWSIRCRDRRITSSWVCGADGANSLVRRRVARRFAREHLSIATGYYVERAGSTEIRIAFEDNPPGYLWSFPRPDHLAVGICAQADESSSGALLRRADAWIARELTNARGRGRRYSWPIPSLDEHAFRSDCFAGPGWMLLGDAAGLVDPITREGIYFALMSGGEAAECLLAGRHAAAAYAAHIRATLHDELIRAARLKAMFFRPQFTSLLVGGLRRSSAIRHIMADLIAGRQTYRGLRRRLLATCEFSLMVKLMPSFARR